MAPFRPSGGSRTRSGRSQNDDVFLEGLPVRQWRKRSIFFDQEVPSDDEKKPLAFEDEKWLHEWPMPKDAAMYPEHSQRLLRVARAGRSSRRDMPASFDEDKDVIGDEDDGDELADKDTSSGHKDRLRESNGFYMEKWIRLPREKEEIEAEYLAPRRFGLRPLYQPFGDASNRDDVPSVPGPVQGPMRKTKVRKTDADGIVSVWEVWVPQGHSVEGEVLEDINVEDIKAAPAEAVPGTVVEGVGIVNTEGVLVAAEIATPRRKPPIPRKKHKKGPGRGKKKVAFSEGMPMYASNGTQQTQDGGEPMQLDVPEGKADGAGDTPMDDAQLGDDDDDDDMEDGDEGDEDEDDRQSEIVQPTNADDSHPQPESKLVVGSAGGQPDTVDSDSAAPTSMQVDAVATPTMPPAIVEPSTSGILEPDSLSGRTSPPLLPVEQSSKDQPTRLPTLEATLPLNQNPDHVITSDIPPVSQPTEFAARSPTPPVKADVGNPDDTTTTLHGLDDISSADAKVPENSDLPTSVAVNVGAGDGQDQISKANQLDVVEPSDLPPTQPVDPHASIDRIAPKDTITYLPAPSAAADDTVALNVVDDKPQDDAAGSTRVAASDATSLALSSDRIALQAANTIPPGNKVATDRPASPSREDNGPERHLAEERETPLLGTSLEPRDSSQQDRPEGQVIGAVENPQQQAPEMDVTKIQADVSQPVPALTQHTGHEADQSAPQHHAEEDLKDATIKEGGQTDGSEQQSIDLLGSLEAHLEKPVS